MADSERRLLDELPNEVRDIDDMDRVKKEFEDKIAKEGSGFFAGLKKWKYKRQVNKFEKENVKLYCKGTHGENEVIDELAKLDDNYHILCGIEIELPYWVTYNGRKNLKSAQMDIVVVCPKGVFMIEVKNWSDDYARTETNSLSPHEQTERAGRVLWIALQKEFGDGEFGVTNVLLSIKGNLEWDEDFRSVYVSSLNGINRFLEKRENILDEEDIEDLVEVLEDFT